MGTSYADSGRRLPAGARVARCRDPDSSGSGLPSRPRIRRRTEFGVSTRGTASACSSAHTSSSMSIDGAKIRPHAMSAALQSQQRWQSLQRPSHEMLRRFEATFAGRPVPVWQALDDALVLLCQPGQDLRASRFELQDDPQSGHRRAHPHQVVDKQTDVEAVTHEVYTALIETAKSPPHGPGSAQIPNDNPNPVLQWVGLRTSTRWRP